MPRIINQKKLPQAEIELEIEVPVLEWDEFLDQAARELSKDLKIKGFRPGHMPRDIVKQKIDRTKILERGAELAVRKSYVRIILKEEIEAIGPPKITILKMASDNPLIFKAQVAVLPEIKIADYFKIAKEKKPKNKNQIIVEEKEIQQSLKWLQKSRAKYITVRREAKEGDRIEIDFQAWLDGVKIKNGESGNHPLILGQSRFVKGFESNLLGMKEGEEKEFSLVFPDDYYQPDLAGKLVDFKVKMKLVQEEELPELNDSFAQSLGNFIGLENLRQSIKEGISFEKEKKEKESWRQEIISQIADQSTMEIPDLLIEEEIKKMIEEFKIMAQGFGLPWSKYLEENKKTEDDLKKDFQDQAKKRVRIALALREIAKKEKIEVSQDEIKEEINKILSHYREVKQTKKDIDIKRLKEYTYGVIRNEKVFQLLEKI